jgi:hypothetical protein
MTTSDLSADRPAAAARACSASPPPATAALHRLQAFWTKSASFAPVLGMCAYFLVLGSIVVVWVTGQVPWFTVAPATILLMVAHFRRVEARWARQDARARERASAGR